MEKKSLLLLGVLSVIFLSGILLHKPILINLIARKVKRLVNNSKYKDLTKYIIAQAKVETGDFSSRLFVVHNNLFGMKNASKRFQLGEPVQGSDFRYYANEKESIEDFLLYLDYVKFPIEVNSLADYVTELKARSYFEEPVNEYLLLMKSFE